MRLLSFDRGYFVRHKELHVCFEIDKNMLITSQFWFYSNGASLSSQKSSFAVERLLFSPTKIHRLYQMGWRVFQPLCITQAKSIK
jgi:hypothetical protein